MTGIRKCAAYSIVLKTIATMNKINLTILSLITLVGSIAANAVPVPAPDAPSLANALKLPQTHAVVFRPTRMAADARLNLAHIRMGDGSVKPGNRRGVMLVVYSSEADLNGNHSIYAQDFHFFSNEGSPVTNFPSFTPRTAAPSAIDSQGRLGIIAILIGFNHNTRTNTFSFAPLPPNDTLSAELTPGDGSVSLLLPAVQKVRAAAARL
ncbi:MAG: hypothetical protein RL088_3139 [Verrucomicrobiota bacterium]